MTLLAVNTSYEPYSRSPEYVEANREFIASLPLPPKGRLLDLACGTGLLSLCVRRAAPGLLSVGLDLSRDQLALARREEGPALLVRGRADVLPFRDGMFDACVMGNAIHILRDAPALLAGIRRVLRPGALFAFNSSFYAGTFVPGTERFYHEWVKEALACVQRRDRALRDAGSPGIPRRREARGGAFSNRWRSAEEWITAMEAQGLRQPRVRERTVVMTRTSFEMVGAYAGMAEVLLSGYPVEEASAALQIAAGPALERFGAAEIPRHWLEIQATAA
jgi:ubiquinone/menaquinone biosynthesis C-methylase UbiE